jgi:GNAT superfamily N-acetyltransferase
MEKYSHKVYTPFDKVTSIEKIGIANFLFEHLGKYGDDLNDIKHCIDYAMKEVESPGGFIITCLNKRSIIGAVIVNETGMSGYIPENILVYIAVHKKYRGKGIGKILMKNALKYSKGEMALHVEPDNPAKYLYEKQGFENKYLEMRYTRSNN